MSDLTKKEEELESEGWKLASTTSGEHLKRTSEMYRELGIQTKILKVELEECDDCKACFVFGNEDLYKIYVKYK